ncbi:MAG TPA: BlaI/MecI/CopY family transcriptional regulator, partial [Candidatus Acidoferrales bacterium]|nr:BlaI/MecI/CopY family transcriptional regulator [Candidatus Acidoferrales bacterium]
MASAARLSGRGGPRRSILDLAPLELECMNTLWPMGEATVRQIQQELAGSLPRAYTTIMTIMDRLAHKGVVTRRKVGRAYLYRPNLTAEEARAHAVTQVVEGFFEGSSEALARHLAGGIPSARPAIVNRRPAMLRAPTQVPTPPPGEALVESAAPPQ